MLYPLSYEGKGSTVLLSPRSAAISRRPARIARGGRQRLAQPWPNGASSSGHLSAPKQGLRRAARSRDLHFA